MAIYFQNGAIPCKGASDLTAARANQRYAVILDVAVTTDLNDNPTVTRSGTTAAADSILGEYQTREGDGTVRVCNVGTLVLRASAAYTAANNGFGVTSSTTAGVVAVAGTIGGGLGRITGGGTEEIDGATVNVYKVQVA